MIKAIRHKHYKRALKSLNKDYDFRKKYGLIIRMSICSHLGNSYPRILLNYPEFIAQMPKFNHDNTNIKEALLDKNFLNYWWDPKRIHIRRKILTKCINDTKP